MELASKFTIGMKVVFTEKAISDNYFHDEIKAGDVATITEMSTGKNSADYPTELSTDWGEGTRLQFVDKEYAEETYNWFRELKPEYFYLGDFVVLKEEATEQATLYQKFSRNTVGLIACDDTMKNGHVKVSFVNQEGEIDYDYVSSNALRLVTKEERKSLRKYKVAKITYDDLVPEEVEEGVELKCIPPKYNVKVGDIAEVTVDVYGHPVGTIGEVTLVQKNTNGHYNRVKLRSNNGDLYRERNVKLVYRKPEKNSK